LKNGQVQWLPFDWICNAEISLGYLYYRGLFHSLIKLSSVSTPADPKSLKLLSIIETIAGSLWASVSTNQIEQWVLQENQLLTECFKNKMYRYEEVKNFSLQERSQFDKTDNEMVKKENQNLQKQLDQLTHSRSWKLTKPLRYINKFRKNENQ